jgi:thiamine biosynthesis lipoprotein
VRDALTAAQASDGLFDPALLPHLEALGYDRDFSLLTKRPDEAAGAELQATYPLGLWRGIKLDAKARRIRLPTGAQLDLGGIAKGWAADRAIKRFFQHIDNVIINVGGDMRMRGGPREGELWAIGIGDTDEAGHPDDSNHRAVITFGHGGLATSGATRRWWYHKGQRQHHVLDPRTGRPVPLWMRSVEPEPAEPDASNLIATATALAPTAARAEVAAKMALLRGHPEALRAVESAWQDGPATTPHLRADRGVALLLVLGNGEVVVSANLEDYLETCAGGGMLWL